MWARIADYHIDTLKSPIIDGMPKATSGDHDGQMISIMTKLDRKHEA